MCVFCSQDLDGQTLTLPLTGLACQRGHTTSPKLRTESGTKVPLVETLHQCQLMARVTSVLFDHAALLDADAGHDLSDLKPDPTDAETGPVDAATDGERAAAIDDAAPEKTQRKH